MARRLKLPTADADMQRWCAELEIEISGWPGVTSRPMFGMLALYHDGKIFAALPRTRAAGTPFSLLVKLPEGALRRRDGAPGPGIDRLLRGGPGANWVTFAMESDADIAEALGWLARAYEEARRMTRRRTAAQPPR